MKLRQVWLAAAVAVSSTPALADHAGPSGVEGGGGVNVISPETLAEGRGAIGFRVAYARPQHRSDQELEALAGRHIHAHNTDYNLNAALGTAYGITPSLTLSAELAYVRRDRLREGEHSHVGGMALNEVVQLGDVAGVGDLSVLAKYRLTRGEGPGLALIAGLKVPTGGTRERDLDGERLETEHQPGTGSWDPIVGAAAGARLGPLRLAASALYQVSGKGAQHTRLGDRAQGGFALSRRFGPAAHHDDHHDEGPDDDHDDPAPHGHRSWDAFVELSGEWEGRQTVDGVVERESGGKSLWLTPGARFNSASGLSLTAALGLPVWQRIRASHPDNDYRATLSVGHGF